MPTRSAAEAIERSANGSIARTLNRKTSLLRIVPTACGQAAGKASYVTSSRQRVAGRVDHVIDARRLRIDRDLWVTIASRSDPSSSRCQISRVPRQAIRLAAAAHNVLCGRSFSWWSQTESNRRPPACKAGALPTELWPLQVYRSQHSGKNVRA